MRALIVDDDATKLQVLADALHALGCERDHIDRADTVNAAIAKSELTRYDLAVVDVVMPHQPDGAMSPDAGVNLIRVLSRAPNRPRWIAAITAQDCDSSIERRLAALGAVLLRYSLADDSWREGLESLIRNLQASVRGGVADFSTLACVVCALREPESKAVLQLPWNWKLVESSGLSGDSGAYMEGDIQTGLTTRSLQRVVVGTAARMGVAAATALAVRMAIAFRPRLLIMTGITAGIRGECRFGDVICADPVFEWGVGKWNTSGESPVFEPALYQYPIDGTLRNLVNRSADFDDDLRDFYRGWSRGRPDEPPRLLRGVVATGPSVVAANEVNTYIRGHHRKVLGIDMEAYALFQAADEAPTPRPRAVSLKAVVDFADERKGDAYQDYAAASSARALSMFLRLFAHSPDYWK